MKPTPPATRAKLTIAQEVAALREEVRELRALVTVLSAMQGRDQPYGPLPPYGPFWQIPPQIGWPLPTPATCYSFTVPSCGHWLRS